jgi:hypothetical protein
MHTGLRKKETNTERAEMFLDFDVDANQNNLNDLKHLINPKNPKTMFCQLALANILNTSRVLCGRTVECALCEPREVHTLRRVSNLLHNTRRT